MKKMLFLFLTMFVLSACNNGKTQSLEAFYQDSKIESVDKIIIQDGSTGYTKTITKQEQINEFLSLIKDIEFTPQKNQEEREGWRYRISLFDGKINFSFTLNEIDSVYYDSSPDIHPIVDDYYNQLEVVEE
jgi:hypothetical protein